MAIECSKPPRDLSRNSVVWPAGAQQILRRTLIEDFAGERIFVNKGRHLSVEGEEAASIFFQLTGWTSVECVSRRGDRVLMDFLLPGDFIGLADEGRYAAFTVTALTDVAALRVERTQFQALCETDPEFPQVYIKALRDSLLRTRNRRLALSAKSSAAKVCEVLSELASRTEIAMKDVPSPRLPITQVSLACAIGLTPVAVNRIVQSLRRAGVLDWGVAGVRILDQRRLREFE